MSMIGRAAESAAITAALADALFLTVHTVETALTRIYRKLGVSSRAGLARLHAANT